MSKNKPCVTGLLEGLDDPMLEDWRDVKKLQQHWIGDCDGVRFEYRLSDGRLLLAWTPDPASAPDGVAFIGVPDTHILAKEEAEQTLHCPSLDCDVRKIRLTAANPFADGHQALFLGTVFGPFTRFSWLIIQH